MTEEERTESAIEILPILRAAITAGLNSETQIDRDMLDMLIAASEAWYQHLAMWVAARQN